MEHRSHDQPETIVIGGMSCAACASRIEKSLISRPGVHSARVNFATSSASISFDDSQQSLDDILGLIRKLGFTATSKHLTPQSQDSPKSAILASMLSLPVVVLAMSHGYFPWISNGISITAQMVFSALVMIIAWREFGMRAFRAAMHVNADMNTLVFLGVSAAFITSGVSVFSAPFGSAIHVYFEASCVTTALVLIGRALETRAKHATGDAVREILTAQPLTARRASDGLTVRVTELAIGDRVTVHKGDRFPADCIVTSGVAIVDESAMTGESALLERRPNEIALGGCINHGDTVIAEVSKDPSHSYLQSLAAAVERLQTAKSPLSRIADQVSGILAPAVIVISFGTFITWIVVGGSDWRTAAEFASCVLVVACPCALGLATPAAIATAAGTLARNGVVFRDPAAIETCARISHVAFDKTGTLTTGGPSLVAIRFFHDSDTPKVRQCLANASRASAHPLAQAIALSSDRSEDVGFWTESPGRGVIGTCDEQRAVLGSESLIREYGIDINPIAHDGPMVLLSIGDRHVASMLFTETLRDSSASAFGNLDRIGINASILSGDRNSSVESIARAVRCSDFNGQLQPHQKVEVITRLRSDRKVAFVGDGLNDAPALAAADLGISLNGATSAATATAGMSLATGNLDLIPQAILYARRTVFTIKANLFWAFAYNAVALPIAAGIMVPINGWKLNPMIASAAMALSSISVVLNSLRLRKFTNTRTN